MHPKSYRIGDFEFDPVSGELKPRASSMGAHGGGEGATPPAKSVRLPPQPAQLLALLAEAQGQIVSREAIRQAIWPDVQVEFDSSLHFCIRQIRSALGDSGSASRYVETLPRRGYRLLPAVDVIPGPTAPSGPSTAPVSASTTPKAARRTPVWAAALVTLITLVVVVLASLLVQRTLQSETVEAVPVTSIGVMPFDPPDGWDPRKAAEASPIGEGVLESLVHAGADALRVVGPSNTAPYEHVDGALGELAAAFELDYIVNGRFLKDGEETSVLAELIRLSDGAHIWVKRYPDLSDGATISDEITREVLARLPPKSASLR